MSGDTTLDRDGQTVTVRVPLKIRRHGGQKMIIAPEGAAPWAPPRTRIDNTMVKAIARAFRWRRLLEEGQYGSVVELADAEKINKSYVSPAVLNAAESRLHREAALEVRRIDSGS
jgi:hypothetical protein